MLYQPSLHLKQAPPVHSPWLGEEAAVSVSGAAPPCSPWSLLFAGETGKLHIAFNAQTLSYTDTEGAS